MSLPYLTSIFVVRHILSRGRRKPPPLQDLYLLVCSFQGLGVAATATTIHIFAGVVVVVVSTIILLIGGFFALRLEVEAGYYECKKCHHKHKASYKEILRAIHFGTTRYLRCPKCNEKSWSKKVLSK